MRRLLAALVVLVALAAAVVTVVVVGSDDDAACGATKVAARTPLQDRTAMSAEPEARRDTLAAAVGRMPAPFGPVVAGADYYYDQFLHLYGVPGGLLAWTKDNAPVTYLAEDGLAPTWSLQPASRRTAWDVSEDRFLLLDLDRTSPVTASTYDLASGASRWCVDLEVAHRDGDPVATTFAGDGDVVTALRVPGRSADTVLTRLAAKDGGTVWSHRTTSVGRADYLGPLGEGQLLVGGVEEFRLAVPDDDPSGSAVTALDAATGDPVWTWTPEGSAAHVVGVLGSTVILSERTASGTDLVALADGEERWRTPIAGGGYEATLRVFDGGTVLTRSAHGLDAYDARTGKRRWHRQLPTDRTYFPYGFTLGQMPSLDERHVLMPTTTSLEVLDLADGGAQGYPLPTDGVSTTYWPYQLVVTPGHLGVIANSGAVLATRE